MTWLTPAGDEMTPEHWEDANARCFGMLLDGRAQPTGIRRRGTDATLLLILNAHHDVVKFTLPEVVGGDAWMCLIDTNQPDLEAPTEFRFGKEYTVTAHSLLLFQLKPEKQQKIGEEERRVKQATFSSCARNAGAIEIGILLCRAVPADIGLHAVDLQAPPCILVTPQVLGTLERIDCGSEIDGTELEAGPCPCGDSHLVGVDDGVGKPADPRHDRDAAIAHGAELGQAAGLEARRHEKCVAAALDLMGERLVITEEAADLTGIDDARALKTVLERLVPGAEQRQLRAAGQQPRQPGENEIEPLLLG